MAKRPAATKRASSPPPTEVGVADNIATAVGRTLGRLVNRKNALLTQLSEVESKIADASRRAGGQLKAYLPATLPGLTSTRKAKASKTRRRSPRKTTPPPPTHGPDDATVKTTRAAPASSAGARGRSTARPRSAPRATRRG